MYRMLGLGQQTAVDPYICHLTLCFVFTLLHQPVKPKHSLVDSPRYFVIVLLALGRHCWTPGRTAHTTVQACELSFCTHLVCSGDWTQTTLLPPAPLPSEPSHQPLQFGFLFIHICPFLQPIVPLEILEQGNHRNGFVFGNGHSAFRRRQDRGEMFPEN